MSGETPKQFTSRLRLNRAAVMLLTTDDSVLNVALACGFQSHEALSRAFRRYFGVTPRDYRNRGFTLGANRQQATKHAEVVYKVGLCIRLFHIKENATFQRDHMVYAVSRKELSAQPVLVIRRRVKRNEIAPTLAEALGLIFQYAQRNGVALAGQPFTRYVEWGPGVLTIEAGMPVGMLVSGEGEIKGDTLPGGPAASTIHSGPYQALNEAHAAVQAWIEDQGLTTVGTPWESYVTDPADYPDPKDWKTEVVWPVAS